MLLLETRLKEFFYNPICRKFKFFFFFLFKDTAKNSLLVQLFVKEKFMTSKFVFFFFA
jgi:hypothetical protein